MLLRAHIFPADNENLACQNAEKSAAKTRIGDAKMHNSFEIQSENVNLGCQNAELIKHPQRTRESVVPERSIQYKSAAETRIWRGQNAEFIKIP